MNNIPKTRLDDAFLETYEVLAHVVAEMEMSEIEAPDALVTVLEKHHRTFVMERTRRMIDKG